MYDERGTDKDAKTIDDLHKGYVMFAKAKSAEQDTLFQGGDNNNQALVPFKRTK